MTEPSKPSSGSRSSRRDFLKTSGAAAVGGAFAGSLTFVRKASAAYSGGDTLKVGLIGCGGRGSGAAAQALSTGDDVVLTAMGDVFEDRVQSSRRHLAGSEQFGQRVKVSDDACFVGLDAYRKVIDSGVDVVVLGTPPGFRPQHLRAAIEAVPTDGLGISSSDLEQLGAESYVQVEDMFREYFLLRRKERDSSLTPEESGRRLRLEQSGPVRRFLQSGYKRGGAVLADPRRTAS